MQVVVTIVVLFVQFAVIFAFRYFQVTWFILQGLQGLSQKPMRYLWFSFIKKLTITIFLASIYVLIIEKTSLLLVLNDLFHVFSFKIYETPFSEIFSDIVLTPNFTWLLFFIAIAQAWSIKKHISEFSWIIWLLSSAFGAIFGKFLHTLLILRPEHDPNSAWVFLVFVIPTFSMGISQWLTFHYLSLEKRSALFFFWIVGWINTGIFIYLLRLLLLNNIQFGEFYFPVMYGIPTLLVSGWLGLVTNLLILTRVIPDEDFASSGSSSEPSTSEAVAFGLASIAGQIAGNMTHEVGKVISDEFKRSTRR